MADEELNAQAAAGEQAEQPKPEAEAEKPTAADAPQPEEEAAEGEQPEGSDDEADDEEDRPKRRSRSARLKDKLQSALAEIEVMKRLHQAPAPTTQAPTDQPPKEADYNGDFMRYMADLTAFNVRQSLREEREQQSASHRERIQAAERAVMDAAYSERLSDFKKVATDFDEVVSRTASFTLPDATLDLIRGSEKGPEIAYHLAKTPAQIRELNAMSPVEAARYIGRLEERLSRPTPKRQTSAPSPISPPSGGAAPKSPDAELDSWLEKTYGKQR